MRVGIEIVNEERRPRPSAVAGLARGAERLGYATVWMKDTSTSSPGPAEAVLVAAGAASVLRLGLSTTAPRVDQLADLLLPHGDALRDRLTVALPGPLVRTFDSDVGRLAKVASLLIASEFDGRDATVVATRGYFAAVGPDLDAARQAVGLAPADAAELVVRLPIPTRGELDETIHDLMTVRAAGADEVVLAAIDEPSGDRAMAVYATLAELLETAR